MPLRTLLLLLVIGLLVLFAALNWTAFTAPTTLWLLFGTVQAPLGLVLLGFIGVLAAAFLMYVVYLQTTVILEARRSARELESQRQLADQAEASRFTELRSFLDARLRGIEERLPGAAVPRLPHDRGGG